MISICMRYIGLHVHFWWNGWQKSSQIHIQIININLAHKHAERINTQMENNTINISNCVLVCLLHCFSSPFFRANCAHDAHTHRILESNVNSFLNETHTHKKHVHARFFFQNWSFFVDCSSWMQLNLPHRLCHVKCHEFKRCIKKERLTNYKDQAHKRKWQSGKRKNHTAKCN